VPDSKPWSSGPSAWSRDDSIGHGVKAGALLTRLGRFRTDPPPGTSLGPDHLRTSHSALLAGLRISCEPAPGCWPAGTRGGASSSPGATERRVRFIRLFGRHPVQMNTPTGARPVARHHTAS